MKCKSLALGTANLGGRYGITSANKFDPELSRAILRHALANGIDCIDTAPDYGIAESLIGEETKCKSSLKIISKIPTQDYYTLESVMNSVNTTLAKINRPSIYGILFHDPEIFLHEEIHSISAQLLNSGIVEKIGFSSYCEQDLIRAKNKFPNWTLFQIPENVLDQRHYYSEKLSELCSLGDEIYVRSIFLQGLLTIEIPLLKKVFLKYATTLSQIRELAEELNVTPIDLCMSYGESIPWNSGTIIAANNLEQLDEIVSYRKIEFDFSILNTLPPDVLDPRKWKDI